MRSDRQSDIKFLKFFVYLMGFVLIFATIFLTYTIYKRSYEALIVVDEKIKPVCNKGTIPIATKIQSMSIENDIVAIVTEPYNNKQKLLILNSCTQEIISETEFDIKHQTLPNSYSKEPEDNHNILS